MAEKKIMELSRKQKSVIRRKEKLAITLLDDFEEIMSKPLTLQSEMLTDYKVKVSTYTSLQSILDNAFSLLKAKDKVDSTIKVKTKKLDKATGTKKTELLDMLNGDVDET